MDIFTIAQEHLRSDPAYLQIITAIVLGALIGLERELAGKDPSLRTFSMISLGSCIFSLLSVRILVGTEGGDPGRIASQVVTGVGFLGAGAIFRSERGVAGLTTAALIWLTAGIGMTVGYGYLELAITVTILSFFSMYTLGLIHALIQRFRAYKRYKYYLKKNHQKLEVLIRPADHHI